MIGIVWTFESDCLLIGIVRTIGFGDLSINWKCVDSQFGRLPFGIVQTIEFRKPSMNWHRPDNGVLKGPILNKMTAGATSVLVRGLQYLVAISSIIGSGSSLYTQQYAR